MVEPTSEYKFADDMPILVGEGDSVEDPYVVDASTAEDFNFWMVELLRRINHAQKSYWKTLSCQKVKGVKRDTYRYRIEKKDFPPEQTVTDTIAFYFRPQSSSLGIKMPEILAPECFVHKGFKIPRELAWLHEYGETKNYAESGKGTSFAYGALNVKATLYIYDTNLASIDPSPTSANVQKEFDADTANIIALNRKVEAWGESKFIGNVLCSGFVLENEFTILLIGVAQDSFFKLRISFAKDSDFYYLLNDSTHAFARHVMHLALIDKAM